MTRPEPACCRTTTWKSCNEALKRRGSLLIRLDMAWHGGKTGSNGRPVVFSGEEGRKTVRGTVFPTNAIRFCLMVKVLFGLPLRQTTGMVSSILSMAGLGWPVPFVGRSFHWKARRSSSVPDPEPQAKVP